MGVQSQCRRIKGGRGDSGVSRNDQFIVARRLTLRFSDLRKKNSTDIWIFFSGTFSKF